MEKTLLLIGDSILLIVLAVIACYNLYFRNEMKKASEFVKFRTPRFISTFVTVTTLFSFFSVLIAAFLTLHKVVTR
jgi:hypothetical protein